VLQHASAALDEVRPQEFFRAGAVMREHGRGKRWLLLRRWKTVRGSKRAELQALFAVKRLLFKAYVLREQLDRLWMYKARPGVLDFLLGWLKALRWQRLQRSPKLTQGCSPEVDHPDFRPVTRASADAHEAALLHLSSMVCAGPPHRPSPAGVFGADLSARSPRADASLVASS
jgi:hypothetical protein